MRLTVDFKNWTGKVALWIRKNAMWLSVLLVFLSMFIKTLGFCDYLSDELAYVANLLLSVITIATIIGGFDIRVIDEGKLTEVSPEPKEAEEQVS